MRIFLTFAQFDRAVRAHARGRLAIIADEDELDDVVADRMTKWCENLTLLQHATAAYHDVSADHIAFASPLLKHVKRALLAAAKVIAGDRHMRVAQGAIDQSMSQMWRNADFAAGAERDDYLGLFEKDKGFTSRAPNALTKRSTEREPIRDQVHRDQIEGRSAPQQKKV